MAGQHPNAGHPGQAMVQQMHPGVSAPGGPQVSQAGPMMGGMPPGGNAGHAGPMPNAHALSHLNPGQAHVFQQQGFPQNSNQGMRPANMGMHMGQQMPHGQPQNIQQQQIFAIQQAQAQQAQAQQQAQNNAQAGQHTPQRSSAQPPNMHETQTGTPQSQHGPPQSGTPQPNQPSQPPSTHPPQSQGGVPAQVTPNPQPQQLPQSQQPGQQPGQSGPQQQPQQQQPQQGQGQQQAPQNPQAMAAQEAQMKAQQQQNAIMMQRMNRQQNSGVMILNSYAEHLSGFSSRGEAADLSYWSTFVDRFFSPAGVLRQGVFNNLTGAKQFEILTPALARYYLTQFKSGIRHIQMIVEAAREQESSSGHVVESPRTSFIYWFSNDTQVFTHGNLRAHFDLNNKIEMLNITVTSHNEYIPRQLLQSLEPQEQKQSPKVAKSAAKRAQKQGQSISLPESMVNANGIPTAVTQFLEVAETMSQMQMLFTFSNQNPHLPAPDALHGLLSNWQQAANSNPNPAFGNQMTPGMQPMGRNPNMGPPSQFASPAMAHLGLPGAQGSPHLTGSAHASPAQSQLAGPPGMQIQPSPAGISNSPNVGGNKRRRASTVKQENEEAGSVDVNGNAPGSGKVKASPRVPKRQKGAAA
ncbi:Transcriptional activator ptaB [Penicillium angulare]|uniref:Transcriptional activator ptaB n=1 Tax=Penicillium angulare TaxID=116970 RepID=A0A9W9F4X5_9EURO|nr:Transcriptional activator ptaB [Penicillium angulare]